MEVDDPMPPPKVYEKEARHHNEHGESPGAAGTPGRGGGCRDKVYEEAETRADNRDQYDAARPSETAAATAAAAAAAAVAAAATATATTAASLNEDDHDHDEEVAGGGKGMDLDAFTREVVHGGNDVKESLTERDSIDEPDADVLVDDNIRFPARTRTMLEGTQEGEEAQRLQQLQGVGGSKRLLGVENPRKQREVSMTHTDMGPICTGSAPPTLITVDESMVSSLPAPTTSKPKGGSVGRRKGRAQKNRKAGSKPSKTGVSLLQQEGGSIHVVECPVASCTGVFTDAQLVNTNLRNHLEKAHGYTRAQLADPNVIKRYQCSCAKCLGKGDAGSNKLVDPKTFFKHLAKTSEPAPEEKVRLNGSAGLSGISNKLVSVSAKIKDNGRNPLPPALGAELTSVLSEALKVLPECMAKLGVHLPMGAPLCPVILSFAIKRTTTGTLQMVFACPSTCQNYQENGLRLPRSYRDHHKAPCHPDNISSFLRCIVSSDCKSKFDRSLFTPTNLEKHMREEHEGLEELCKPGKAVRLGGRLAVLPQQVLDQIGDRWADLEHKDEMGSPYRNSKNNEVYFFSAQVTNGDGGELVIQPGYTLDSSAKAKLAGGQAAGARAASAAAMASHETTVAEAAASVGKKDSNMKNEQSKKKPDKAPAVGPAVAAAGSTPASPQKYVNWQPQIAERVLARERKRGAPAAGEDNACAAVSRAGSSGAPLVVSPVNNCRSPNEENMLRGGRAAAVAAGVGRDGSGGGGKGGEGFGQGNRPHRRSLSRLSLKQRNAKSLARENPQTDSPQAKARSTTSLNRANEGSPLRGGRRPPACDAALRATRGCTGSDSGTPLSPSPPFVPAVPTAMVVDVTANSSTHDRVKRKRAVDLKSPLTLCPPAKGPEAGVAVQSGCSRLRKEAATAASGLSLTSVDG